MSCFVLQRVTRRLLPIAAMCVGMVVSVPAESQKTVDVFYVHTPFTDPGRIQLFYRMPGWDTARVASGLAFGDRLPVMQGGKVCFRIRNANPMLYAYGSTSEVVKVNPPEGYAALLEGIVSGVAGLPISTGGAQKAFMGVTDAEDRVTELS